MTIPAGEWLLFAGAALLMVLTPGPNMIYVLSRSVCQGRRAGFVSLLGVVAGFVLHVCAAAIGLSAVFMTVPLAYELLKWAGAAYLLWLAWQALRPGAGSPFEPRALPPDSPRKLFAMGFITNLLNPKIAVFYLSVLPQFVAPERGSVFVQSLTLGLTQIAVSFSVNSLIVLFGAALAAWFAQHRLWLAVQRYLMGFVLGALAVRLALEPRRAV
jgi:threonine/homoserine/homoserine lactone efflux protein